MTQVRYTRSTDGDTIAELCAVPSATIPAKPSAWSGADYVNDRPPRGHGMGSMIQRVNRRLNKERDQRSVK